MMMGNMHLILSENVNYEWASEMLTKAIAPCLALI